MENSNTNISPTPIEKFQTPGDTIEKMIDMESHMKDLRSRTEELENKLKVINRASAFIMWIVGAIAAVFLVIVVEVSLDYFINNQARYENFTENMRELGDNFYKKDELAEMIVDIKDNTRMLECIKLKGYLSKECFIKD